MNKLVAVVIGLGVCALSNHAAAQALDMSAMKREITIMENIIKASVATDKGASLRRINGRYLLNQGITFDLDSKLFNTSRGSWASAFADRNFDFNFDFDFSELDAQAAAEEAQEISKQAIESVRELAERMRDLAENERDIEHDIRSLEREKRDLEFERRNAEKDTLTELEKRKNELEQQVKALEKQKDQLKDEQHNLKTQTQKNKQQQQQQWAEQRTKSLQLIQQTLVTTLCDYGAGLKSLPDNERVNFALSRAGEENQDLILVFEKKDIQSCVMGKIKAQQLLTKASVYSF